MPEPLTAIRNLGPATAAEFARAGIVDAAELREIGADRAYARLIEAGTRPHFIGYYALVMGLQGRPWNDCKGKEKTALRARFDALCRAARPAPGAHGLTHEAVRTLDAIGVRLGD